MARTKNVPCKNCEGIGQVPLLCTMFYADGYRRARCGICGGSGINPEGYHPWPSHVRFLKEFHARTAEWGGLKPKPQGVPRRPASRPGTMANNGFPDDTQFQEHVITSVERQDDGTYVISNDGWCLWCGEHCPVEPKVGQVARYYGKGFGYVVRGLFIDGHKFFYRTEAEQAEHSDIQSYGADAADWLARWDRGDGVWSIAMGGLGPGYEQAIQIAVAEIVRWLLKERAADDWEKVDWERMGREVIASPTVDALGLSGAQWGAAKNLAAMIARRGPRAVMRDDEVKDRHIQVCRVFPQAPSLPAGA